ncbi:MAG TPA: P-II family nitrogen regulator [Haloplasmataceae bacterium]
MEQHELIIAIVNQGKAKQVIRQAKKAGVRGATIFYGKSIDDRKVLRMLEMHEIRKEIVLMLTQKEHVGPIVSHLKETFDLETSKKCFLFTVPVVSAYGLQKQDQLEDQNDDSGGIEKTMYKAIFTIVDRGKAEKVLESAKDAGAKGGTIINGRGSADQDSKLFNFPIEPEKEIVLIVTQENETDNIVQKIRTDLDIDQPGAGIIFVLQVDHVYGIQQ